MIIKASVLNPEQSFTMGGLEYLKGTYIPFYDNKTVNEQGEVNKDSIRVGIRSKADIDNILQEPIPVTSWSNGTTDYSDFDTLLTDITGLLFNLAGESAALKTQGFIDYNDTSGDVTLTPDTWIDVPNNGLGAFTNRTYKPTTINDVLDGSTGYLDFSELTLGSQLLIRNDFTVTPNTNNSLLEVRYLLGQGAGEYALKFWSERLDSGSGIGYQRVISFPIYLGDTNTQGGVGKLQVKLSTNGSINNAGSYVKIDLR